MNKLAIASQRRAGVDAAIDLAAAVEVLFSVSLGDSSSIRLTLRRRAARLLGNTREERVEISRNIWSLYNLRSNVVHEGHAKKR